MYRAGASPSRSIHPHRPSRCPRPAAPHPHQTNRAAPRLSAAYHRLSVETVSLPRTHYDKPPDDPPSPWVPASGQTGRSYQIGNGFRFGCPTCQLCPVRRAPARARLWWGQRSPIGVQASGARQRTASAVVGRAYVETPDPNYNRGIWTPGGWWRLPYLSLNFPHFQTIKQFGENTHSRNSHRFYSTRRRRRLIALSSAFLGPS
jgi:hypothetical protein